MFATQSPRALVAGGIVEDLVDPKYKTVRG